MWNGMDLMQGSHRNEDTERLTNNVILNCLLLILNKNRFSFSLN